MTAAGGSSAKLDRTYLHVNRLLRAIQAELALHATAREEHYRQVDPGQLARYGPASTRGSCGVVNLPPATVLALG
jgi:hypothetical protein